MSENFRTYLCAELSGSEVKRAARLVYESFAEFYESLRLPAEHLLALLAAQLITSEGTELEGAVASADSEGRVTGLLAAYPASEMLQRQLASVFGLIAELDENQAAAALATLSKRATTIPAPPPDSFYLARLAVSSELRGTGVGDSLIALLHKLAGRHTCISLHVSASNGRAIGFYLRHGFKLTGSDACDYRLMTSSIR